VSCKAIAKNREDFRIEEKSAIAKIYKIVIKKQRQKKGSLRLKQNRRLPFCRFV